MLILKGNRDGVSIIINEHAHIEHTIVQLRAKLKETGDFFRGAAFKLVTGDRELTEEEFEAISGAAEEFGVCLYPVQKKTLEQPLDQQRSQHGSSSLSHASQRTLTRVAEYFSEAGDGQTDDVIQSSPSAGVSGVTESISDTTLLLRRTIRSGQRIEYNGNVVVMGDVNAGAVVTCIGDIIVLGALRGVAHAGAEGNEEAVVLAFRLEPTQLRIAHYISRSPDEADSDPIGPELASVKNGMIYIEAYVP